MIHAIYFHRFLSDSSPPPYPPNFMFLFTSLSKQNKRKPRNTEKSHKRENHTKVHHDKTCQRKQNGTQSPQNTAEFVLCGSTLPRCGALPEVWLIDPVRLHWEWWFSLCQWHRLQTAWLEMGCCVCFPSQCWDPVCLKSVQASCTLSSLLNSYVSPVVDEDNVSLKSSITSGS